MQANELTADLPRTQDQTGDQAAHGTANKDTAASHAGATVIRVEYGVPEKNAALPAGLLAAVSFGHDASACAESSTLCVNVGLEPLIRPAPTELWWANGAVERGRSAMVRYARDDHHLFAVVDLDEREHGGIRATAEVAYAEMRRFQQQSAFPHLLRMWNYFDAINEGAGDLERYRQFCVGRTRGLGDVQIEHYPAATAIGLQQPTHHLLVYWLAGRTPGKPIENPRQVSAYRYPRAHGPTSPTFARATLTADGTLLVSGTASIVGHVSQHGGDSLAQLDETLRNLAMLSEHTNAGSMASRTQPANPLLKVYVRDQAHITEIAARLRQHLPRSEAIFLAADICRRELLLEIECVQAAGQHY